MYSIYSVQWFLCWLDRPLRCERCLSPCYILCTEIPVFHRLYIVFRDSYIRWTGPWGARDASLHGYVLHCLECCRSLLLWCRSLLLWYRSSFYVSFTVMLVSFVFEARYLSPWSFCSMYTVFYTLFRVLYVSFTVMLVSFIFEARYLSPWSFCSVYTVYSVAGLV